MSYVWLQERDALQQCKATLQGGARDCGGAVQKMGDAAEQGGADTIPPAATGSPMTIGSALAATYSCLAIATYRNCEKRDM